MSGGYRAGCAIVCDRDPELAAHASDGVVADDEIGVMTLALAGEQGTARFDEGRFAGDGELSVEAAVAAAGGERGQGEARAFADLGAVGEADETAGRSEEHTSELQSLMRISYAVLCLKTKTTKTSP